MTGVQTCALPISIRGKVYYGLGIIADNYSVETSLYAYDLTTKQWQLKNRIPWFSNQRAVAYFTVENLGYVLFKDGVFCEYNPETDSWRKLQNMPFSDPWNGCYNRSFFVLDNNCYVGLGMKAKPYQVTKDFYYYDPSISSWQIESIAIPLTGRYNSLAFEIGRAHV